MCVCVCVCNNDDEKERTKKKKKRKKNTTPATNCHIVVIVCAPVVPFLSLSMYNNNKRSAIERDREEIACNINTTQRALSISLCCRRCSTPITQ